MSPVFDARAVRRDSCSSMRASNPWTSGSGSRSTSRRPRRIASADKSIRVTDWPAEGELALVEDEIDDPQNARKALPRSFASGTWYGMRASRIFAFAANDPLRQRGRGRQECLRDFLGREAAHFAQRERDLRLRCRASDGNT
jgi:hypothetical protein